MEFHGSSICNQLDKTYVLSDCSQINGTPTATAAVRVGVGCMCLGVYVHAEYMWSTCGT